GAPKRTPFGGRLLGDSLALRELEATSRLGLAVLLALHDTRVAGKESACLQRRAQRRLIIGQRPTDAMPHRAGLPGKATALHGAPGIVLVLAVGGTEGLHDDLPQRGAAEIVVAVTAVDGDPAAA